MNKIQKIVVLGIIENDKGKILITQRLDPKIKDAHLKRDVPGGRNEFGESLEETLIRETKEETGLNIEIIKFLPKVISKFWKHDDYDQHTLLFCYICKFIDGTIHLDDPKIQDIKRINPKSDLNNFDFLDTTSEFINHYLSNQ